MVTIDEYKCPNCAGAVKFDSSVQKMKCPYFDAEFETSVIVEYQKNAAAEAQATDSFKWTDEAVRDWKEDELDGLSTGSCPSCGAELVGDQNTVAMVCPCCGNAQIVSKRLVGLMKPNYVIPFKLDKKAAVAALKDFCKDKRLLPDFFVEHNHINRVQGLYVPFWLFDAKASGNIRFKATKVKYWMDSRYNYIKTDYYSIIRDGALAFEKVPVDGSEKMDDDYMDSIEPFYYTDLKDFHSTFLAGDTAEKYDVDASKSRDRAARRIKSSLERAFAKSVTGYVTVTPEHSIVSVHDGKVSYAFFPVWVLNTKYNDAHYTFMMNGQTGRLVGRLPVDSGKAWKYRLLIAGILGIVSTGVILLTQMLR
jgi:predicted RNA-binding Zn-ribbon protein involved in translation (DUF1610 family)